VPALRLAEELGPDAVIIVNLSGRGDKDVDEVSQILGMTTPAAAVAAADGHGTVDTVEDGR